MLQVLKNWAKLFVLLGILPWAYVYITQINPIVSRALGVDRMPYIQVGFYLIPIVLPPLLLFSWLSKGDEDGEQSQ